MTKRAPRAAGLFYVTFLVSLSEVGVGMVKNSVLSLFFENLPIYFQNFIDFTDFFGQNTNLCPPLTLKFTPLTREDRSSPKALPFYKPPC